MFEIKKISNIDATGARTWAFGLSLGSVAGGIWLLGAALAC